MMDAATRRTLLKKACNEYRTGKPCVQRKPESKMVMRNGVWMHKGCAEVDVRLKEDK